MIVVTGAAGFIGSNVVADLMKATDEQICVCDWKCRELKNLMNHHRVPGVFDAETTPEQLPSFLDAFREHITVVIHMGAISSTTEHDWDKLMALNTQFTINLWMWCAVNNKRLIYASSASVYGQHSTFYDTDNPDVMREFKPLNDYGKSKLAADMVIATLAKANIPKPAQWAGLRFFNVYGPNEWHKGEQASLITKSYGKTVIELFDVAARRDFVYVKDCTRYILRLLDKPNISGIFNIGTGESRLFEDIARIMGADVRYIPMPDALKGQYQFMTRSVMNKAKYSDLWFPPTPLEDGIQDYIANHLSQGCYR
jgi:ADP-L-glycero-D-manno-heptose 6-epimerase